MRLSSVVLLEGGDADNVAEGEEVTLKNWGNVRVDKVEKDDAGEREIIFVVFVCVTKGKDPPYLWGVNQCAWV